MISLRCSTGCGPLAVWVGRSVAPVEGSPTRGSRHRGGAAGNFGGTLGSDRFRIFSAQAKGAFQCQEILPRVRFALEQSGESRRQVRDALGAGEAKDRHEL